MTSVHGIELDSSIYLCAMIKVSGKLQYQYKFLPSTKLPFSTAKQSLKQSTLHWNSDAFRSITMQSKQLQNNKCS